MFGGVTNTVEWLVWMGVFAPLWMIGGVAFVATKYPGYSHRTHVLSALGARERPTAKIHPYINNYPIGVLFICFGVGISSTDVPMAIAALMVLHGISHIVAGLFPCDEDLGRSKASASQKIHNTAGMVMYFSLLFACLWVGLGVAPPSIGFVVLSFFLSGASVFFLVLMLRAIEFNDDVGLYQRLSLGALLVWVMVWVSYLV